MNDCMQINRNLRKILIAIGGSVLIVLGLAGLVLPIVPGTVLCITGLVLWSSEFPWAKKTLAWFRQKLDQHTRRRKTPAGTGGHG